MPGYGYGFGIVVPAQYRTLTHGFAGIVYIHYSIYIYSLKSQTDLLGMSQYKFSFLFSFILFVYHCDVVGNSVWPFSALFMRHIVLVWC